MTKDVLAQYCDLREEVKDIRKRIERLQGELDRIESERYVTDSVTGGMGGTQHYIIKGFPYPEYSRKKTKLYLNKAQYETAEPELLDLTIKVEEYIQSIIDSRIRRILRYRYLDDMTWHEVALRIGGKNTTADSVRMEHNRFLGL